MQATKELRSLSRKFYVHFHRKLRGTGRLLNSVSSPLWYYLQRRQLEQRFPFLRNRQIFSEVEARIRPAYERYVEEVSSPDMALSLQASVFLAAFCEGFAPKRILDLGSGFSSFVFRSYAASRNGVFVWSVDDSLDWLEQTRAYLASYNLSTERLVLWNSLETHSLDGIDLVCHDLGRMALRKSSLNLVLKLGRRGVVFFDDMHKPLYASHVREYLSSCSCRYYDLRAYTLDEFGRYSGLVSDVESC